MIDMYKIKKRKAVVLTFVIPIDLSYFIEQMKDGIHGDLC